jgi:hypothetical protein
VINVTVCGSWWRGAPDERGIPHTTMRDGAPNGYSIFTFDGQNYDIEFRAASRPKNYQMNIYAPEEVDSAATTPVEVLANVFAGSERSTVEMRVGDAGSWVAMKRVEIEDPVYAAVKAREDALLAAVMAQHEAAVRAEAAPAPSAEAKKEGAGGRRRMMALLPFIPLPEIMKSPHIWSAELPGGLAPGTHMIQVRTKDMFGRTYTESRSIRVK